MTKLDMSSSMRLESASLLDVCSPRLARTPLAQPLDRLEASAQELSEETMYCDANSRSKANEFIDFDEKIRPANCLKSVPVHCCYKRGW